MFLLSEDYGYGSIRIFCKCLWNNNVIEVTFRNADLAILIFFFSPRIDWI